MLRDKPSGERELKSAKFLHQWAQRPLTHRQTQVAEGLLGVNLSTVYRLSIRFLKDLNGYFHDLRS